MATNTVNGIALNSALTSIADAIRAKGGTSESLAFPTEFIYAINNIPTGGSDNPNKIIVIPKQEFTVSTVNGVTSWSNIEWDSSFLDREQKFSDWPRVFVDDKPWDLKSWQDNFDLIISLVIEISGSHKEFKILHGYSGIVENGSGYSSINSDLSDGTHTIEAFIYSGNFSYPDDFR